MFQNSLIVSPLAAENNVPKDEAKRQTDEKLGLDGAKGQRRVWAEDVLLRRPPSEMFSECARFAPRRASPAAPGKIRRAWKLHRATAPGY